MPVYREHAFQQAWSSTSLRLTGLRSDMGQRVDIVDAGRWNHLGGPDFLDARILIDGNLFMGAIELHLRPGEWYAHRHHLDAAYNCVVLHASPLPSKRPIVRCDGTRVPHINLERIMPALPAIVPKMAPVLPCAGILHAHTASFTAQLELANGRYFEELAERQLSLVRAGYNPASETIRAIFIRSCSILGAPANRDVMAEAATTLWDEPAGLPGIEPSQLIPSKHWRLSGGRPASRPHTRLGQAYALRAAIMRYGASVLASTAPKDFMRLIVTPTVGSQTSAVIYTTAVLPGLWVHSTLMRNTRDAAAIRSEWDESILPPSPDASRAFGEASKLIDGKYLKGLTWQHRNLCALHGCGSCKVGIRKMN
jgi:hypothetical protein